MAAVPDASFWRGKRVLLSGHTGFKGAWTALWLADMGARVTGFALPPHTKPALYDSAGVGALIDSHIGDLRDPPAVAAAVDAANPEIVLHMAAQPIVRRAIAEPAETIDVNVLGTTHLLSALRSAAGLKAILVVTSDKVYDNAGDGRPFAEHDRLGGKDPYSASKAAAELITRAFADTYFSDCGIAVATARGGNVIGGGDYADDRIVPDIVRAIEKGEAPVLRMPDATRPWQHVLDCISGYLIYAEALAANKPVPRALNFGPRDTQPMTVAQVTEAMLTAFKRPAVWIRDQVPAAKEMTMLAVDSSRARETLGWRDHVTGADAIDWTAAWYSAVAAGTPAREATRAQIACFPEQARAHA